MSNKDTGAAAAAGFGVAFLLAGIALLLQELDLLTRRQRPSVHHGNLRVAREC